jgi:hypothetical protein
MVEYCAVVAQTSSTELSSLLRRYYQCSDVRKRMYEFLGGTDLQPATAIYITGTDGYSDYHIQSPPADLAEYLEGALEVDRSLWDRGSLIADIDVEYHNFDYPGAAWQDPERAFRLQQPVLEATLEILGKAGMAPLILVSGRGFHLVWAVRRDSKAFVRLVGLGRIPASLQTRYAQPCASDGSSVDPALGRAFAGLGMVLEFVGHAVLASSADRCRIPIQPAAIEVGPGIYGREIVSFDLSEYGDPLHTRHMRLPFSAYLKPRQYEWMLGEAETGRLLPIFEIPLCGMSPAQAIQAMRNSDAVLEIARHVSTEIPDESESMEDLLNEYQHSELAKFHGLFYSQTRQEVEFSADLAPPCAQFLLEHPNDWLLKPAALQHVVRVLMALGWSPSAIARRICGSYSQDCNWGDTWARLDPCNRAIFYTRLFAGMITTGLDKLIDFNCVSHQKKGYCMIPECSSNLILYRDMLVENRKQR